MSLPRLVNLLDDFALGGVSRGLGIFASAPIRSVADCSVAAVSPTATIAPRLDAEIIVIHFPPNWRRLAFLASLRLRNPKARIIQVEHSYTRSWEQANVPDTRRFRLMLNLALRCVDQVVCVSAGQASWLKQAAGLTDEQVEIIYPYSDNPGLADVAPIQPEAGRPLRVGTYGRFHKAKGFDRLIKAYAAGAMPGTELMIGGFGDEEERLRELARGVAGIRFAGKITDVAAFLEDCDVIVLPSRYEAFGQVANEAREAGRPILVSPVDGLPEQVGQAGMVVDFTSHEAIKAAFASLNPERLHQMAEAGRWATRNCGLDRQYQWAWLIKRLTAQHQRPAYRLQPA